MKKCPKCEKVMSDNSAFCDMCGSSLESVEAEEEILEEVSTIPPVELLEPEILDEPETLEPEKAKSQLEERGKSFFQSEPELEQAYEEEQKTDKEEIEEEKVEEEKTPTLEDANIVVSEITTDPVEEPKEEIEEESETEAPTEPETVPETEPETEAPKEPKTVPEPEPETEAPTEPETVPETEPPKPKKKKKKKKKEKITTEPEKVPKTIPKTAPPTEPKEEPKEEEPVEEPEIISEEIETISEETEAPTEPETVPETEPETEAPTKPKTVPETEPETEPVTESETKHEATASEIIEEPQIISDELLEEIITETTPVTEPITEPVTIPQIVVPETVPVTAPVVYTQPETAPIMQPVPTPQPQVVQVPLQATQEIPIGNYIIPTEEEDLEDKTNLSLMIGIGSLCLCVVWPLAIVGFEFAYKSPESKKRTLSMIINALTFVLGVIAMILVFTGQIGSKDPVIEPDDTKVFYGEGYTLSYNSSWNVTKRDDTGKVLQYNSEKSYFGPIGQSDLSVTIDCDFSKISCKSQTYDEFYNYWSKEIDAKKYLFTRDSSFALLKDDIYYATYNYSLVSSGELVGKYYIVISVDKNSALSFYSEADELNLATLNPEVIELLKTIKIEESNIDDPDNPANNLSNWNVYKDLRSDAAGRKKTLYGEYRMLSNDTSYWVFKNGEFWWYKSEKDLNDNYWYGTISVKTGKRGIASVGLEESRLDAIMDENDGNVSASDIYSIILTPKKIVSGGEDKSSTNIPKGTKWKFVWTLINHKDEGIEAEVLNVDTADMSYFVKVKD